MTADSILLVVMSILNMLGAVMLLAGMQSYQLQKIGKVYKVILAMAIFGLMWQAMHDSVELIIGIQHPNTIIPFWYLKDLAWTVMGVYFGYLFYKKELTINLGCKRYRG